MQSLIQLTLLGPTTDKFLHDLHLHFFSGFESTGVVENITGVICKSEFVLDIMFASLRK